MRFRFSRVCYKQKKSIFLNFAAGSSEFLATVNEALPSPAQEKRRPELRTKCRFLVGKGNTNSFLPALVDTVSLATPFAHFLYREDVPVSIQLNFLVLSFSETPSIICKCRQACSGKISLNASIGVSTLLSQAPDPSYK